MWSVGKCLHNEIPTIRCIEYYSLQRSQKSFELIEIQLLDGGQLKLIKLTCWLNVQFTRIALLPKLARITWPSGPSSTGHSTVSDETYPNGLKAFHFLTPRHRNWLLSLRYRPWWSSLALPAGIVSSKGASGQGNCVYIKSHSNLQHATFKVGVS